MRPDLVVMPPPLLDADPRLDAIAKPIQGQILVAQSAVERFVGRILPRLAGIDQRRLDLRLHEPAQNRARHELRSIVGAQVARRPVDAHQLR